jgi:WD40 repeat protein
MKHDAEVSSAQFSADGQRVVTASSDGTARVWDAATGKALSEPMKHDGLVRSGVSPTKVRKVPQDFCQQSGRKGFSAIPELPRRDLV